MLDVFLMFNEFCFFNMAISIWRKSNLAISNTGISENYDILFDGHGD